MERYVGKRVIINIKKVKAREAVRKHLRCNMIGDTLALPW